MKPPKLVEVTWIDSAFNRGWDNSHDKAKSMSVSHCRTAGYLVERTKDVVKVVMSTADDCDSFSDGMSIPAIAVKRVRVLK